MWRIESENGWCIVAANWLPDEYVASIYHIDFERLWAKGYRAVITDLDNTLTKWDSPHCPEKLVAFLASITHRGFQLCVLSNNTQRRVDDFVRPLGIKAIGKAGKPRKGGFMKALFAMKADASKTIMIGDQVFTDIIGGNRAGLYTVLVRPIDPVENKGTKFMRHIERVLLRKMQVATTEYFRYDKK